MHVLAALFGKGRGASCLTEKTARLHNVYQRETQGNFKGNGGPILTDTERQRFRILQEKEDNQTLDAAEAAEWQSFIDRIEAEEAAYLHPAAERERQERQNDSAEQKALLNELAELKQRVETLESQIVLPKDKAQRAS